MEETVTVTSEAPVIDVRSSVTTYTVDQNLIRDVPIERSYADVLTTLPGVTTGSRYTYSLTQAVHGSSVRDNDYILDGQSTKHPSGYSGTEFSIEALELTQASTSGVSAEYGQSSGGVFTFVTKSGGDNFAGSTYYYIVDEAIQSENVSGLTSEQNAIIRDTNYGGNIGGPVIKEKLWFFFDFNRNTKRVGTSRLSRPIQPVTVWIARPTSMRERSFSWSRGLGSRFPTADLATPITIKIAGCVRPTPEPSSGSMSAPGENSSGSRKPTAPNGALLSAPT